MLALRPACRPPCALWSAPASCASWSSSNISSPSGGRASSRLSPTAHSAWPVRRPRPSRPAPRRAPFMSPHGQPATPGARPPRCLQRRPWHRRANPPKPTRPAPPPGRPPHPHSRRRPPPHRPTCDFQAVLQSCRRTTILFRYQNNNALLPRQRQGRADGPRKPFFSQNEVQGLGPWRGAGQRPALPSALISARYRLARPASSVARSIAAIRLVGSARPVPAILNAVPWSGEVRMIGRPSVVFTPWCISSVFSGISA